MMYPNPVTDHFYLFIPEDVHDPLAVEIYTGSGIRMWESKIQVRDDLQIDATSWPSGIYWCRMISAKKIIVGSFAKE